MLWKISGQLWDASEMYKPSLKVCDTLGHCLSSICKWAIYLKHHNVLKLIKCFFSIDSAILALTSLSVSHYLWLDFKTKNSDYIKLLENTLFWTGACSWLKRGFLIKWKKKIPKNEDYRAKPEWVLIVYRLQLSDLSYLSVPLLYTAGP